MTEVQNGPSDGGKYIDQIDPDDPEYVRQMQRPAEVKEDMKQMEDRSRVSLIMKSRAFREELEEIINDQLSTGPNPASLLALQQITELIMPKVKSGGGTNFAGISSTAGNGPVLPIADIRGVDSLNYSKPEKVMRNKVATLYRLVDLNGWSNGFNSLITTRLSQDFEHFLVMPYGLLYNEVSASNLIKVDMRGEMLDPGSTSLQLNRAAFSLHAAIHAARPDIRTIIHLRNPTAISVSVQNCGLLPLSPEAMALGELSYYTYSGALSDQEERDKLTRALGPNNKVIFLRSYGAVVGGASIDEAFLLANNVMSACETQLRTVPVGLDNIAMPSEEVRKKAYDLANQSQQVGPEGDGKRKWRRGEIEFEAVTRQLDHAGYRTGHVYREPMTRRTDKRERANSEVEIPPTATSGGSNYEDDFRSPLKHHLDKQKKTFRTEWLNSPNAYKREDLEEIGTQHPKKITKWVKEGETVGSPSVKVENPNQFAPIGENPKELKSKYKEIKKEYYEDKIDAGPQSRILEGITYEEARKIQDGHVSGTSDTMIVMGAASKGIIQRDHQHNAVVYKTTYAPNPFDNMSEDEVARYKAEVQQKSDGGATSGGEELLTPGPDGRLISTEERMQQVREGSGGETIVTTTVTTKTMQKAGRNKGQGHPRGQYLETSIDDLNDTGHYISAPVLLQQVQSPRETNIDSPDGTGSRKSRRSERSPRKEKEAKRSQSARLPAKKSKQLVEELQQSMERRAKDDSALNGDESGVLSSPTKSTSSAEGTFDETERSSREASPHKEPRSPEKGDKKDKKDKKKFRMPSFSTKKKEKK